MNQYNQTMENIKILINQGINFLDSNIDNIKDEGLIENVDVRKLDFCKYIYEKSPLIANEIIDKMLDDKNTKVYVQNIIDVFDNMQEYIYTQASNSISKNFASVTEFKAVMTEYLNMIQSNLEIDGYIEETFAGWCEDGNIFYLREKEIGSHSVGVQTLLMNHFDEDLNNFTNELDENIFKLNELEKEQEKEDEEIC